MTVERQDPPYLIIGCGYTGTRLAQALRADGVAVRACARRMSLLAPLEEIGVDVHYLDAGKTRLFGPIMRGLPQPVVVYSVPGVATLPVGEAVRRAADAALQAKASAFIYLSTTGVYGRNELSGNEEWVDEDSSVDLHDPDMSSRLADEAAVASVRQAGLRTVVLRLSAIYGPGLYPGQPGRGVRQRLRSGQYRLWDGGRYYFSRIHVDDLVAIIRAAGARAPAGALYAVGDDHPCPQGEYGRWLAASLGLPEPPSLESLRAEAPRQVIRGRRINNKRLKTELGITLRYPSYVEGERQIDEYERSLLPTPPAAAAAAGDQAAPAAEVPMNEVPGSAAPVAASSEAPAAAAPAAAAPAAAVPVAEAPPAAAPASEAPPAAPSSVPPAEVHAAPSTEADRAAANPSPGAAVSWPFHLHRPGDLGAQLGLPLLDVAPLTLAPGASTTPGPACVVLAGAPVISWQGARVRLVPLDLVPPGVAIDNPGDGQPVLLLTLPRR